MAGIALLAALTMAIAQGGRSGVTSLTEDREGHLARCWIPPAQRAEARFRAAHPDSRLSKAGR